MGCGNWLHIAHLWLLPLGTGGPALDQRSHITPETYRTAAASVSKEHLSVPGPCSAQALTKQLGVAHRSGMSSRTQGKGRKMLEPMAGVQ